MKLLEQFKDRVVLIEAGISRAFVEYSFKNRWIFKKPLLQSVFVERPINKTIYWAYSDIARRSEKPTRSCVRLWFPRHSLPQVSHLLSSVYLYPYLNYLTGTHRACPPGTRHARTHFACEERRMSKAIEKLERTRRISFKNFTSY